MLFILTKYLPYPSLMHYLVHPYIHRVPSYSGLILFTIRSSKKQVGFSTGFHISGYL